MIIEQCHYPCLRECKLLVAQFGFAQATLQQCGAFVFTGEPLAKFAQCTFGSGFVLPVRHQGIEETTDSIIELLAGFGIARIPVTGGGQYRFQGAAQRVIDVAVKAVVLCNLCDQSSFNSGKQGQ